MPNAKYQWATRSYRTKMWPTGRVVGCGPYGIRLWGLEAIKPPGLELVVMNVFPIVTRAWDDIRRFGGSSKLQNTLFSGEEP